MNLVHASDSPESAERELKIYFGADGTCQYEPVAVNFLRAMDE